MKTLRSARLRLEPLAVHHAGDVCDALQDDRLYAYISDTPPQTLAALEKRFALLEKGHSPSGTDHWLNWIACLHEAGEPVGWLQATVHQDRTADLAYIVFAKHWHKGYARETCRAVLAHLFAELKCVLVSAYMDTENARSVRLVEALGFERKELIKAAAHIRGRRSDEYRYELSLSRWSATTEQ